MDELREGEWVARVIKKEGRVLEAKLNPKLSAIERTYLASQVAGMYVKLSGEGIIGLSEELEKATTTKVLRP